MSEDVSRELPKSWSWAGMGDLGDWAGGGTPSKFNPAFWNEGSIPWVSPKDMKTFEIFDAQDHITQAAITRSATTLLPADTVLIVTRSGILRHTLPVAVSRVPVTLNQDIKAVTPHGGINPAYVARALQAFGQRIIHTCAKDGTTVQSIETSLLRSFRIPLAPQNEQVRILDTLDELLSDLDAGVAGLERARAKLKHYRAAVLKAAVVGTLTAEWRRQHPATESADALLTRILAERRHRWEQAQLAKFEAAGKTPPKDWKAKYVEPVEPDTRKLPALPEGWQWASFEQVCDIQGGLQKQPGRTPREHHYPYLRVANVLRGILDLSELKRFELTSAELLRYRLEAGDLLIVEGNGSKTEIGRCAIWKDEIKDCVHQNHIIRVRLIAGVIPAFADQFLNSPAGQRAIQSIASSTSGLYTLSVSKIAQLPMVIVPIAEQAAIVEAVEDQLSVIDHLERDLDARLDSAKALRQSILRHAFSGQLVPQDPNDEPASELLKRIAAEREERARLARAAKQAKPKSSSKPRTPRRRAAGKQ